MPKLVFYSVDGRTEGQHISPNAHACHEIVFYGEGCNGELLMDGQRYAIRAGAVSIMHQGQVHEELHTARGSVTFFGFQHAGLPAPGIYYNLWSLKPLFDAAAEEMRTQAHGYERLAALKLAEILLYIERAQHTTPAEVKDLSYCKQYIEENYMQKIHLRTLAQMTGYSTEHFRHLYTAAFGQSPQKTLIDCRIAHAAELLKTTDRSCTQIAHLCGFSDSAQMSKMLKARYALSPMKIRKGEDYER